MLDLLEKEQILELERENLMRKQVNNHEEKNKLE